MKIKLPPPIILLACGLLMSASGLPENRSCDWHCLALLPMLAGLALMVACVRQFRRHQTTLNPFTPDNSSHLVVDGVYRYSRNPMYLGMALLLTAWSLWLAQPWTVMGVILFMAYIQLAQIRPEERALSVRFGAAYDNYCRRTRRWL